MPALDYDAFRRSLQKGEVLPAYYLYGDDDYLKDEAARAVVASVLEPGSRDFNLDRRRAGDLSAEEFATLALTPPMLAARRVVIVSEVEALQQRRTRLQGLRAGVLAYLARPSPETVLVLVQSAGEKADPDLVRGAGGVNARPLSPERVLRWIQQRAAQEDLALDAAAARHLHEAVGDDLAQLDAELRKLKAATGSGTVTVDDVGELVGVRRGETLHDLTDAVTERRFAEAAGMVRHLLEAPGTSGVKLVSVVATSLVGLALARALLDEGTAPGAVPGRIFDALTAARPSGLRGWRDVAARWARDAERWRAPEIEAALETLLAADRRLKSASLGGDADILREAVLAMGSHAVRAA
jgi:DNA polymerase-3 subunit delta